MTLPFSKVIDLQDFDSSELRPYLYEINEQDAVRFGSSREDLIADAKQWEYAMTLRALDFHHCAEHGRMVAGIGAGTEATIFALARRGVLVFPVDRYLRRSVWSDTAPAGMLVDPERYSLLDMPVGHVIPVHSSALQVNLPSDTFDAVFSSGSLEHLGSFENVGVAAAEIGRILKPGGVATIATQFRVDGPDDLQGFDDNLILFTPQLLERHVVESSGLVLREPLALLQSERTFETRHNLVDFIERSQLVHTLDEKRAVHPNLVLYQDGFLFCSVILTLHKERQGNPRPQPASARAKSAVAHENSELTEQLEQFQRSPALGAVAAESHALFGEVERLRAELAWLHAEYGRSNAWKTWPMMRPARFVYRRFKRWRR
jgi:SAM-dependent methyltransferase